MAGKNSIPNLTSVIDKMNKSAQTNLVEKPPIQKVVPVKTAKSVKAKPISKVGRPTNWPDRKSNPEYYYQISGFIKHETAQRMSAAMMGKLRGKFKTKQELYDKAINFYLDKALK